MITPENITFNRYTQVNVDGTIERTLSSSFNVSCEVQPTTGWDLKDLPDLQESEKVYTLFVQGKTIIRQPIGGTPTDYCTVNGDECRVYKVLDYTNTLIPHTEIIVAKV